MQTKTRTKSLVSLLLALILVVGVMPISVFAATVRVTFDTGSPTRNTVINVESGSRISPPSTPRNPGHIFRGWYKDSTCYDRWDFDRDVVTGSMTLYAGWYERDDDDYYYGGNPYYYGDSDYYYGYYGWRVYDEEYDRYTYTNWDNYYYYGYNGSSGKIRDKKDVEGGMDQVYTGSGDIVFTVYGVSHINMMSMVIYPEGNRNKEELLVKGEDYSVKSSKGGAQVTLKPYLLNSLKNGKYDVRMYFVDEQANASFTVKF